MMWVPVFSRLVCFFPPRSVCPDLCSSSFTGPTLRWRRSTICSWRYVTHCGAFTDHLPPLKIMRTLFCFIVSLDTVRSWYRVKQLDQKLQWLFFLIECRSTRAWGFNHIKAVYSQTWLATAAVGIVREKVHHAHIKVLCHLISMSQKSTLLMQCLLQDREETTLKVFAFKYIKLSWGGSKMFVCFSFGEDSSCSQL